MGCIRVKSNRNRRSIVTAVLAPATLFAALLAWPALAETYRLVHAIGNDEQMVARDLSSAECDERKSEYKKVAEVLRTYNERTGQGSIVCLPESIFVD